MTIRNMLIANHVQGI